MSGSRYERQLVNYMSDRGYHVVRAPSSGGGTKRSLPDAFWSKEGERSIAAELKTTRKDVAYFAEDEVTKLLEFATAFNAAPRLVARFKGDTTYYVCRPQDCEQTDANTLKVTRETNHETIDP